MVQKRRRCNMKHATAFYSAQYCKAWFTLQGTLWNLASDWVCHSMTSKQNASSSVKSHDRPQAISWCIHDLPGGVFVIAIVFKLGLCHTRMWLNLFFFKSHRQDCTRRRESEYIYFLFPNLSGDIRLTNSCFTGSTSQDGGMSSFPLNNTHKHDYDTRRL